MIFQPSAVNRVHLSIESEVSSITKNKILGSRVDSVSYTQVVQQVITWAQHHESRYVCTANVHMFMEAYDSLEFQNVVNAADLVTPDGMPLVWSYTAWAIRSKDAFMGLN